MKVQPALLMATGSPVRGNDSMGIEASSRADAGSGSSLAPGQRLSLAEIGIPLMLLGATSWAAILYALDAA